MRTWIRGRAGAVAAAMTMLIVAGLAAAEVAQPVAAQAAGGGSETITWFAGKPGTGLGPLGGCTNGITGDGPYSGDGGPALGAGMGDPTGIVRNAAGDIFFSDPCNNRIREISTSGKISTYAGDGTAGYTGDGGPAVKAELSFPEALAIDGAGNVYVIAMCSGGQCVRKITPGGIISTVYTAAYTVANGYQAFSGIAANPAGDLYLSVSGGPTNYSVIEVAPGGKVTPIAGGHGVGTGGEEICDANYGGPALSAEICSVGIALDPAGNIYVLGGSGTDLFEITDGVINLVAGGLTGEPDGSQAPMAIAVDSAGDAYVATADNFSIDEIAPGGTITTLIGNGETFNGVGPAANDFTYVTALSIGASGALYSGTVNGMIEMTGLSAGTVACGCATTGAFVAPAVTAPANTATSPGGSYTLTTSETGSAIQLKISSASTSATILTIDPPAGASFAASPSWGFGPDGKTFALEYSYQGLDVVQLYDITAAEPGNPVWTSSSSAASSSIGFSPDGTYFLAAIITPTTEQTSLTIVPTAVPSSGRAQPVYFNSFISPVAPGAATTAVDSANWGFSPTSTSFTFTAVDTNDVPGLVLVSLPSGKQTAISLTASSAAFTRFSPCGDVLGLISQTGAQPTLAEAVLYSTSASTLGQIASQQIPYGNSITLQATPTSETAVVTQAGGASQTTTLADNTANLGCQPPATTATVGGSPAAPARASAGRRTAAGRSAPITDASGDVSMSLPDNRGQITFPGDISASPITVTYLETDDLTYYPMQSGLAYAGLVFTLDASGALADSYTDAITYSPAALAAAGITNPGSLSLYWWNGTSWTSLASTVDTSTTTVTASTEDLGQFALLAPAPAAVKNPAVAGARLSGSASARLSGTLATFAPAQAGDTTDNYLAFVNWGDGSATEQASVVPVGSTFAVTGTHIYAAVGAYKAAVTVVRLGGSGKPGTATATITIVGPFSVKVSGPVRYSRSGVMLSSTIKITLDKKTVTAVKGAISYRGAKGGTATIKISVTRKNGRYVGTITVTDARDHLRVTATISRLSHARDGEVAGTASWAVKHHTYTVTFTI
jgi:hypothetical protein